MIQSGPSSSASSLRSAPCSQIYRYAQRSKSMIATSPFLGGDSCCLTLQRSDLFCTRADPPGPHLVHAQHPQGHASCTAMLTSIALIAVTTSLHNTCRAEPAVTDDHVYLPSQVLRTRGPASAPSDQQACPSTPLIILPPIYHATTTCTPLQAIHPWRQHPPIATWPPLKLPRTRSPASHPLIHSICGSHPQQIHHMSLVHRDSALHAACPHTCSHSANPTIRAQSRRLAHIPVHPRRCRLLLLPALAWPDGRASLGRPSRGRVLRRVPPRGNPPDHRAASAPPCRSATSSTSHRSTRRRSSCS